MIDLLRLAEGLEILRTYLDESVVVGQRSRSERGLPFLTSLQILSSTLCAKVAMLSFQQPA